MCFKLYPDCKVVIGKTRSAIYDLTRNGIFIIPRDLSECIDNDNVIHYNNLSADKQKEFIDFLLENELGRFNMPKEIVPLSNEFISPSKISNAILDIGNNDLPLHKIALELSELVCESVFLRFVNKSSLDYIITCSKNFISQSMSSLEIGIRYEGGIEEHIYSLIQQIQICTRIIVVNSPFIKTEIIGAGIPIRYVRKGFTCNNNLNSDFSSFSNANLPLYLESLKYNNCLNGKLAIDQYGNIKNCPELAKIFGNINNDVSLSDIVESSEFQRLWKINKDCFEKCQDCELRYACQHCIILKQDCSYNVYKD
ncbi:MAG: hypothetical protein SPJ99_03115 [Candidatus Coprenecus sp.]|nr:hypothetical protein [Candidatus Coprenecus sp.]